MRNDSGRLYYGTGIDNSQLRADAEESKRILQGITGTAVREGNQIDTVFREIGKTAASVFAVSRLKDFAVQVANVRGEFQQLEAAFRTLLGSADKADTLMSQLVKTAATTPFGLQDVAQGARQLLAYGLEAEKVNGTLIRLGDIAAGLSIPIGDLAYLYGTTMVQGRMYTQDLNQFLGRGIPLVEELAKQFGVSENQVRQLVEDGKVGFPEVQKAIESLTSEGGKFGGLMEAQSRTITGQISNIEDSIAMMFNDIGKSGEGMINTALSGVSYLVENYKEVGRILLELSGTYGAYKAALIALNAVEKLRYQMTLAHMAGLTNMQAVMTVLREKTAALNGTMLANPYALAAAAIAGLAYGIYKLTTYQTEAEKAQKKLNEAVAEGDAAAATETSALARLKGELSALSAGTDEYNAVKDKIVKQFGKYYDGLDEEITKVGLTEAAYGRLTEAIKKSFSARQYEKFAKEQGDALESAVADNLRKIQDRLYKELGDEKGSETYTKIRDGILQGTIGLGKGMHELTGISKELQESLDKAAGVEGGIDIIDRSIEISIGNILRAKKLADETDRKARERFGIDEDPMTDGTGRDKAAEPVESLSESVEAARENVARLKKELSGLQSGKLPEKAGKGFSWETEIENKKKELDEAQKTLRTLLGTDSKTDKAAGEIAGRERRISEYKEKVENSTEQAELDIRQTQINALEDGYEKTVKQIDLNYDRLIAENDKRRQDMLDALEDIKVDEWLNKNPKATKKQELGYRASLNLTEADLTVVQRDMLKAYADEAEKYRVTGNRKALDDMLEDVLTYEQQRLKIAGEYEEKRRQLFELDKEGKYVLDGNGNRKFREGVTQGNVDELDRQAEEALQAVDEQFAQREETYKAWCGEIASYTLEQLQNVLEQAENELDGLQNSGTASESRLATARAKVNTAKKKVSEANAKNEVSPDRRSIKEWEDLYKVLQECEREFESIGGTVGGVAGEIISSAGGILASTLSMINGIVTLVNNSSTAIQATSTAAAESIATVEKASVILTVISAALQIATAIANLFNSDNRKQKEIEALQERIDQLQWELDNADAVRLQDNTFKALERIESAVKEVEQEFLRLNKADSLKFLLSRMWDVRNNAELMDRAVKDIAGAFADLGYTADKALGGDKYKEARTRLENLAEQQILISKQIQEEQSKKKTDHGKIAEWERQIQELAEQAVTVINGMVEDIIGGSAQDIAEELGDAFMSAFQEGEDAAEAWGDKVDEIVAGILKRMMIQELLEKPVGAIFDKYKTRWFGTDGNFKGFDAVQGSLTGFANELDALVRDLYNGMDSLPDELKDLLIDDVDAERQGTEKGIAAASQDSVDYMNGIFTNMQGHTFSINENVARIAEGMGAMAANNSCLAGIGKTMESLISMSGASLDYLAGIESHTAVLETMNENIRHLRGDVNDILLKGVKMK